MNLLYLFIGLFGGILGGMGVGGGVIVISILTLFLHVPQQTAQGLNLIYFIPTAISALVIHIKNKSVNLKAALIMVGCGILGAVLGSNIAVVLSSKMLSKLFAVFLVMIGAYEIFKKRPKRNEPNKNKS